MTQRIEISSRTIIFTVFFLLSLRVIWTIRELIYALLLAFIFMSALKPLVNKLVKVRFPRPIAAFGVLITAVTILGFVLAFIIPPIVSESIVFLSNLPLLLVEAFPFLSGTFNSESAIQFLPDLTQNAVKVASSLFSNVFFIVSVIFFTFYFLMEERFFESFLSKFLDKNEASRVASITRKIELRMGAWMRGQLILMITIGFLTYIGLSILGIRFALSLAFLAGLLEVIPIIGPVVSSVPAFLVASSSSMLLGGGVIGLYLVIQQLENNVVVPYVMNRAVGIHPITTLIALSIGGKLGGLLGAILAVPLALLIETVITEITGKKR